MTISFPIFGLHLHPSRALISGLRADAELRQRGGACAVAADSRASVLYRAQFHLRQPSVARCSGNHGQRRPHWRPRGLGLDPQVPRTPQSGSYFNKFILFFSFFLAFFLLFLLNRVAERVLVLWPGVRPEPEVGELRSGH